MGNDGLLDNGAASCPLVDAHFDDVALLGTPLGCAAVFVNT